MDFARPPAPWSIETGSGPGDEHLRIGRRTVRLAEIAGCDAATTAEVNVNGHMAAIGLFLSAGALFVLPVVMNILHPRFLAGGILFIGIGLMALADILQGHGLVVHRVSIRLVDGGETTFASPHAEECRRLVAALQGQAS